MSSDRLLRRGESSRKGCNSEQTAFLDWFHSNGGQLDSRCRLAEYEDLGTGMVAAADIDEDELLFSIPRHMPQNLETSRLPALCRAYDEERRKQQSQLLESQTADFDDINTGWTGIILTMLWERYRSSTHGKAAWEAQAAQWEGEAWYRSIEQIDSGTSARDKDAMDTSTSSIEAHAQSAARSKMQWGAYFDVLPTHFDTPMFWTSEELGELAGTSIPDKLGREEAEAAHAQQVTPYIHSHAPLFLGDVKVASESPSNGVPLIEALIDQHYSLHDFHVMGSLLLSRAFHVTKPGKAQDGNTAAEISDDDSDSDSEDGEEQEEAADVSMVPMADMLNARFGCDNAHLFYKTETLEMRATRPIKSGEQIWNTYGEPPSSDLLRRYGHVDVGNPADIVELAAENLIEARLEWDKQSNPPALSQRREICTLRMQWACALGVDDVSALTSAFAPADTPPYRPRSAEASTRELREAALELPEDVIVLARVLCMSDAAFQQAQAKDKLPNPRIDAIDGEDEGKGAKPRSVTALLSAAIDNRLRAYKTSADEDETLLYGEQSNAAPLSRNVRNATIVRLSEKRILLDTKQILAAVQEAVASKKRKSAMQGSSTGKSAPTAKKSRK